VSIYGNSNERAGPDCTGLRPRQERKKMAKRSNGGDNKAAHPAARRRTDKAPKPTGTVSAPDAAGARFDPDTMSLRQADTMPSPVEVQRRAYELYLQRGGSHGHDLDDWYEAERQLRRQEGRAPARG
jgi:hypothetical protein